MNALALLQEIQARVDLAAGTATFLLVMPRRDAELEEARRLLAQVLGVGRRLADLGACTPDDGPAAWVERTHAGSGDVLLLSFVPRNPLEARTFARGLNAQREILRELPAPTVLVVPPAMEASLRESAPDFFTWIAQTYVLPDPTDLATAARALGVSDDEARPPEAAENPVRFLHISDLHLKPDRVKRYDQDRVYGASSRRPARR